MDVGVKYSVVITPDDKGTVYVDGLKDELFSKIGLYNSRRSKAHVTICEFFAGKQKLNAVIRKLKEIASFENPVHIKFDGVDSYPNGAVFLKPTEATKAPLKELMVRIQKQLNIKNSYKSKDPHMSIARKLSNDNVEIALKMFAEVKLDFNCTNIVLRKFNPDKKQYEIFSTDFPFLGLPP
ncbi:MAG: 2'-5' RNA ligase family protein, partial [Pedobacter sp.]